MEKMYTHLHIGYPADERNTTAFRAGTYEPSLGHKVCTLPMFAVDFTYPGSAVSSYPCLQTHL